MTSKICIYDPRRIYVFTQATLFCRDVHTPPGSSPFLSPSPCSSPSPTEPHPHSLKNPTPLPACFAAAAPQTGHSPAFHFHLPIPAPPSNSAPSRPWREASLHQNCRCLASVCRMRGDCTLQSAITPASATMPRAHP